VHRFVGIAEDFDRSLEKGHLLFRWSLDPGGSLGEGDGLLSAVVRA
jgi:hypothetical protein